MNNPDLTRLSKIFERYREIQAVYLFGSAVHGNVHQESDIDLAIIPSSKGFEKKKVEILADLARHGFCDVDLVILEGTDIVLQYEALRQNVLVYQRPGFDRGATYSKTVRQYLDFYPYLSVQREAYKKRILDAKI